MGRNEAQQSIEARDVWVRYGAMVALRGAFLRVDPGEICCVIGPNGAGKSTLLSAIAGGVIPVKGSISWGTKELVGQRPERIARLGLSLVPEGRHVFGSLTVEENLKIGSYMHANRRQAAADLERVLQYFPRLRERLQQPGGNLSGGEQQMLAIGRALMTRPRILLVDEPSLGLAPKIVDQIYEILATLRNEEELTILINEQSSNRILKYADKIYVLRGGVMQLEGRAASLQDGVAIKQAYFGFSDGTAPIRQDPTHG